METKEFNWLEYVELGEVEEEMNKLQKRIKELERDLEYEEFLSRKDAEQFQMLEAKQKEQERELEHYERHF